SVQEKEKRPVHKGAPFYSIGILLLFQTEREYQNKDISGVKERQPLALSHIALAYIEDLLNSRLGHEIEADVNYAGLALKQFFDIEPTFLDDLKKIVSNLKMKGKWGEAYAPLTILKEVINLRAAGSATDFSRTLKAGKITVFIPRQPIGFPKPWDKRVFVGGNYLEQKAVIALIEEIVSRQGFEPVVMAKTIIPSGKTHHHSLMMLHTCKYAIIDVSDEAGQLMELERTFDFEIEPLVLIKNSYWNIGKISEMVKTWREIQPKPYNDSSFEAIRKDLETLIKDYLK
ncbi:hypothetical protein MUP77_13510, partial [Candidatus Bathyarchaeota archaeon]|nr:hypothetical protein [Candidatus Bathyarchaeota archaeon]